MQPAFAATLQKIQDVFDDFAYEFENATRDPVVPMGNDPSVRMNVSFQHGFIKDIEAACHLKQITAEHLLKHDDFNHECRVDITGKGALDGAEFLQDTLVHLGMPTSIGSKGNKDKRHFLFEANNLILESLLNSLHAAARNIFDFQSIIQHISAAERKLEQVDTGGRPAYNKHISTAIIREDGEPHVEVNYSTSNEKLLDKAQKLGLKIIPDTSFRALPGAQTIQAKYGKGERDIKACAKLMAAIVENVELEAGAAGHRGITPRGGYAKKDKGPTPNKGAER